MSVHTVNVSTHSQCQYTQSMSVHTVSLAGSFQEWDHNEMDVENLKQTLLPVIFYHIYYVVIFNVLISSCISLHLDYSKFNWPSLFHTPLSQKASEAILCCFAASCYGFLCSQVAVTSGTSHDTSSDNPLCLSVRHHM